MTSSVAVVGAGIAGLICARTLNDNGLDVTVFDKARTPGGRLATRRGTPDLAFDHGAQYFTARTPQFSRLVELWKQQGFIAEWRGRIVSLENGVFADTKSQTRFVGLPEMSAVGTYLATELTLYGATRIEQISRAEGSWELTDDADRRFGPFDFLVLSLPAPQSAVLLGAHPFSADAAAVAMTPCWATLVAFQDRLEVPWDGAFVSGSPLAWVARNSSKPGRPCGPDCWVLHASPEWSAIHLDDAPDIVGQQLLNIFAAAVGRGLPNSVYLAAHRWRYSLGADPAERVVLFDAESRLAVCGDWLSSGRVEGAYLSGIAAANLILWHVSLANDKEIPQ